MKNRINSRGLSKTMLAIAVGGAVWGVGTTASASVVCDVIDPTDDINAVGSLRYCVDQVNQGAADTLNVNPDWYELEAPLVFEGSADVFGHGSIVLPGDNFEGDSLIEVGPVCPGPGCTAPATVELQGVEIGAVGFGGVRGIDVKKGSELILWGTLIVGFDVPTEGGCIRALEKSTVTVHDSSFEECKAADGGAIWSSASSTEIHDSTFENNEATYNGGAIRIDGSGAHARVLDVQGSEFVGNQAALGGALSGVHSALSTSVFGSDFYGNIASQHGGAVWGEGAFDSCRFDGNEAGLEGGALYLLAASELRDSSIYASRADEGAGVAALGHNTQVSIDGTTFAKNLAEAPDGGGGGGLLVIDGEATVLNSTFSENLAFSPAGNANGGGIAVRGKGALHASHVTLAENSADQAGGIAAGSNAEVTLLSSVVVHSAADDCDIAGSFMSETSLDADGSCNVKWTDKKLLAKPLDFNGGPTQTRILSSENTYSAMCFDTEDQRNEPRASGTSCDLGAVEPL